MLSGHKNRLILRMARTKELKKTFTLLSLRNRAILRVKGLKKTFTLLSLRNCTILRVKCLRRLFTLSHLCGSLRNKNLQAAKYNAIKPSNKSCHCERSEAIQPTQTLDCFVVSLLAMTGWNLYHNNTKQNTAPAKSGFDDLIKTGKVTF